MKLAPALAKLLALPEPSRTIGAFRLIRQLGKGGFAPVWLASEVYGGAELRTVAVKLFCLDRARDAQRAQVVAEARALCKVEHPNIVRFLALAVDDTGDILGLAMEHVHGTALDERLHRTGKLPLADTLAAGCAVASALAAAHHAGVVHRDIKPANVIDAAGVYKLIDFGIASVRERPRAATERAVSRAVVVDDLPFDLAETHDAAALAGSTEREGSAQPSGSGDASYSPGLAGTLGYMDPFTLATLGLATPASDLYALGALLFECLAGVVPALAAAQRAGVPGALPEVLDGRQRAPRVADVVPGAPAALAQLVDALLEPDPAKLPRSAEAVAWELQRIRRKLAGRSRPLPPEEHGPFRGLGRFEAEDRDVFFGRGADVAAGLELLRTRSLVALVGASGSGKSSLARAGLVPAVVDGELGDWPKRWDAVTFVPGADPKARLVAALAPLIDASALEPGAIADRLAARVDDTERGVVLLVDQLEELVTTADPRARAFLVDFLERFAQLPSPGLRCIVTARRDLFDELLGLPGLGRVLARGVLLVAPLSDAAWDDALDQALASYGYRLEGDAMRAELLAQVKGASQAMPLVQFALTELWAHRDKVEKVLPRAALEKVGGVSGALERHAEATCAPLLRDAATTDALRRVLLALTTPKGSRATRASADLRAVAGDSAWRVLGVLSAARLVVEDDRDNQTIAHEALLVAWTRLRDWIAGAREDRLLAARLEQEAEAWDEEKRPGHRLLRGLRLLRATAILDRGDAALGPVVAAFVRASRGRRRVQRALLAALGAVMGALVVTAGVVGVLALLQQGAQRIKIGYCATLVYRRQAPECISTVDDEARRHRAVTHRVSTQGERVVKVERVDASGAARDDGEGAASWDYHYGAEGAVHEIVVKNRLGKTSLVRTFNADATREERRDRFGNPAPLAGTDISTSVYRYDARGFAVEVRFTSPLSNAARRDERRAVGYAAQRDARGLAVRITVLGPDGVRAPDDDGVAEERREFDAMGNETALSLIDLVGEPATQRPEETDFRDGYATTRRSYDAWGNETEVAYFDAAGKPTRRNGYARRVRKYDARGHVVETVFYDRDGELTRPRKTPYAVVVSEYDDRGNEVVTRHLGTEREPVGTATRAAVEKKTYDDRGDLIQIDYVGSDEKAAALRDGTARRRWRTDERGNTLDVTSFGVDGEPIAIDGYAKKTYVYDDRDNAVELAYFDAKGAPTVGPDGAARVVSKYDERNRRVEEAYFGTRAEAITPRTKPAIRTWKYDERGKEVERANFSPDGAPVLYKGAARERRTWDDAGNEVEVVTYGMTGRPIEVRGIARTTRKFDARGRMLEEAFFGADGRPTMDKEGLARRTRGYDARGHVVREAYFGVGGEPVLYGTDKYAGFKVDFDANGYETSRTFLGVDGKPIMTRSGYATRQWTWDDAGNPVEVAYLGTSGKPTLSTEGIAGRRTIFDELGNPIHVTYLGVGGGPARANDGYASYAMTRDARGVVTEIAYFGIDGKPIASSNGSARIKRTFDAEDNAIEHAFFDVRNRPMMSARYAWFGEAKEIERSYPVGDSALQAKARSPIARRTSAYDARGNAVAVASYDLEGKPSLDEDGVASWTAKYDARGNLVEKAFFGTDGRPGVSKKQQYARVVSLFDEQDNETERAFFGVDGAPIASDGAARWVAAYDQNRNQTDIRYFGADGRPVNRAEGYSHLARRFGARTSVDTSWSDPEAVAVFDVDDKPTLHAEGWASYTARFDDTGHEIERAYFGVDGRPALSKAGYARRRVVYDERGRETESEWFGVDGGAIAVQGVARTVVRWDARGQETERAWFAADGRLVMKQGFARRLRSYDRDGRQIQESHFGADGKPLLVGGRAGWTRAYDEQGDVIEEASFGADGRPVLVEGCARRRNEYDELRRRVFSACFGTDAKPALDDQGVASRRYVSNDWGKALEVRFFGVDGRPAVDKHGVAIRRAKYSASGALVELASYGADGKPVAPATQGARTTILYDGAGREIQRAQFGVRDEPVADANGCATTKTAYESDGRKAVTCLDVAGVERRARPR